MIKQNPFLTVLFIICSISTTTLFAQDRSFKIGINRTNFRGKPEKDASGKALEKFSSADGITAALTTEIPFDNSGSEGETGVRFELCYSSKKFNWNYDGQSYQIFDTEGNSKSYATGKKTINLEVKNHYFELPIMFYRKMDVGLEIAGGLNLGLLLGSNGKGSMTFDGTTENGTKVPIYTSTLDYDYNKDEATTVVLSEKTFSDAGQTITLPASMGAYYEARTKNSRAFNNFNIGLNADIAYWFGERIALRIRGSYNFFDLTSNKNTYLRKALDVDKKPIQRKSYENLYNYYLTLEFKL